MNDIRTLIRDLAEAAHTTGYYAGKGEVGHSRHITAAIRSKAKHKALIVAIEQRIHKEETVS